MLFLFYLKDCKTNGISDYFLEIGELVPVSIGIVGIAGNIFGQPASSP